MAQLRYLSHRCTTSHRPQYTAEDTSVHPGDRCLTTPWHLGSRALPDTKPCRLWDPAYMAPSLLLEVNNVRGLVGTQAPKSRAVTCSAKRLSPHPGDLRGSV